jgi:hypothetical protein
MTGCLAWVLATSVLSSLSAAPQPESSRVVLLTAVDARARVVIDAGPDDFVVEEGGEPRDVLSVHQADYPIVLLLDDASEAREDVEAIREAALRFIGRLGERAVAIGTLTKPTEQLASLSDDRATVIERVRQLKPSASSERGVIQAAAYGATAAKDWGATFVAIVVMTKAEDATDAVRDDVTSTLMTAFVDSGAVAHVVALAPSTPGRPEITGAGGLLRELADATHGQYTRIFSSASYSAALDRLADALAAELMVEYLVPARSTGGALRVGIKAPGVRIQSLTISR